MAPKNTEPSEMAMMYFPNAGFVRNAPTWAGFSSDRCCSPNAAVRKFRYVGALSSTLDRQPLPQKNCRTVVMPKSPACFSNKSSAGTIVRKMPMNKNPTSRSGPKLNSFSRSASLFAPL